MRKYLDSIPEGYSVCSYGRSRYAIIKQAFNDNRSFKVFASELGGNDVVSLNFYVTKQREWLKPCEMRKEKVIHFLKHLRLEEE